VVWLGAVLEGSGSMPWPYFCGVGRSKSLKGEDVYFTRGASLCRFGSQAPVVRCVPWFDRRVSEGITPPLGPVGLFSIVWVCRAACAAATLKRVGLRCVEEKFKRTTAVKQKPALKRNR